MNQPLHRISGNFPNLTTRSLCRLAQHLFEVRGDGTGEVPRKTVAAGVVAFLFHEEGGESLRDDLPDRGFCDVLFQERRELRQEQIRLRLLVELVQHEFAVETVALLEGRADRLGERAG